MADEADKIGQDEIEQLLQQAQNQLSAAGADADPSPPVEGAGATLADIAAPTLTPRSDGDAESAIDSDQRQVQAGDVDLLFQQAEQALASVEEPLDRAPSLQKFELIDFSTNPATAEQATLDLMRDVELDLKIELGRTHMHLEDVLKLGKGSVVPLDKLAGDPVDIFVNGRLVARGEVLVLNDNFGVRVAELISGEKSA
tara:strand:+ start:1687 stop:2283 length:597 start_codon:yes stop_codon:yes gene_type:complete